MVEMDLRTTYVQEAVAKAHTVARQKLLVTLRDLAYSIEGPKETVERFGWSVSITLLHRT